MKLNETDLLQLQSNYMQNDLTTQGFCAALNPQVLQLVASIAAIQIYSAIDQLAAEIIDELAWQFHLDFYDQTLPLENRRQLVKNSLKWHKKKGTPAAVEGVVSDAFEDAVVQEWFDYGADPYKFRVFFSSSVMIPGDSFINVSLAIDSVKNIRSLFEGFYNIFFCGTFECGQYTW